MNRAFSAGALAWRKFLGRRPRLFMNAAPLALTDTRQNAFAANGVSPILSAESAL
jgi:hypothetical protein